jgi:electron transfer flavoprotein alpha subunit
MAEVLVLAEHAADGEVKKVTLELLTAARRLGSPSVVWTGPGSEGGLARLAEYGAEKVYVADSPDFGSYVVAPAAELLAQLVASVAPAAVLVAGTTEGKEVAGRLAVKTGSGVLTDAVEVTAGPGRRPGRGAAELRRRGHRPLGGAGRHPGHRGPAQRGQPRGAGRRRRGRGGLVHRVGRGEGGDAR